MSNKKPQCFGNHMPDDDILCAECHLDFKGPCIEMTEKKANYFKKPMK